MSKCENIYFQRTFEPSQTNSRKKIKENYREKNQTHDISSNVSKFRSANNLLVSLQLERDFLNAPQNVLFRKASFIFHDLSIIYRKSLRSPIEDAINHSYWSCNSHSEREFRRCSLFMHKNRISTIQKLQRIIILYGYFCNDCAPFSFQNKF